MHKTQAAVIGLSLAMVGYFLFNNEEIVRNPPNQATTVNTAIPSIDDCVINGSQYTCYEQPFNGRMFQSEDEVLSAIEQVKAGTYQWPKLNAKRIDEIQHLKTEVARLKQ